MHQLRFSLSVLFFSVQFILFTKTATLSQCQTITAGNWENPAVWTNCAGAIPTSASNVVIRHNIVSTAINFANNLTFADVGQPRSLSLSSGVLTLGGNYNTQFGSSTSVALGASLILAGTMTTFGTVVISGRLEAGNINPQQGTFTIDTSSVVQVSQTFNISNGAATVNVLGALNAQDLTISGGSTFLNVRNKGRVNISNNTSLSGSGIINVDNGGYMSVGNNLNLTGGTDIILNGLMDINGNLNFANNGNTVSGSGTGCINFGSISCPAFITAGGSTCEAALISGVCIGFTPLPLTWIETKASCVDQGIGTLISWTVASPEKSGEFLVERSSEGNHFEVLATLTFIPSESEPIRFQHVDRNLFRDENYYRISVKYQDGEVEHSRLFTGNCQGNFAGHTPVVVYQNGELMLTMPPGAGSQQVELQICDRVGRLLEKKVFQTDSNLGRLYLPIQLKSDLYLIRIYAPAMGMASSKLLVE